MSSAIALSGGGSKGAFTVGALKALNQAGKGDFDVISGTSTGSLIAALVAAGQYDLLEHEYKSVENIDILSQDNILRNISLDRPYFYDTLPLEAKIETYITDAVYHQIMASGKYVCFTAISLQTGRRTVFATKIFQAKADYDVVTITSADMLRKAILASTNQAAFLKPVDLTINGRQQQFVDGGNRDVIPVRPLIDIGADEIFVLSNNPRALAEVTEPYTNLLKVLLRAISIFIQDVRENDYAELDGLPEATVHKIQPLLELDRQNPTGLNFNKGDMLLWMRNGYLTARDVLAKAGMDTGPFTPVVA